MKVLVVYDESYLSDSATSHLVESQKHDFTFIRADDYDFCKDGYESIICMSDRISIVSDIYGKSALESMTIANDKVKVSNMFHDLTPRMTKVIQKPRFGRDGLQVKIFQSNKVFIVEQFVSGVDSTVLVFKDKLGYICKFPVAIIAKDSEILDYDAKKRQGETFEKIDDKSLVAEYAETVFKSLSGFNAVRIDFKGEKMVDINLLWGVEKGYCYAQNCMEINGKTYDDLIDIWVDQGVVL